MEEIKMSWDVDIVESLDCEYEGILSEVGNYTYNVSPMYMKAMGLTISGLHGKRTLEVVQIVSDGVIQMSKNIKEYQELNPSNGWGNYEGAKQFLKEILIHCLDYPEGIVRVS
jgi:hypothetical protein